jgi:hypothetical protein
MSRNLPWLVTAVVAAALIGVSASVVVLKPEPRPRSVTTAPPPDASAVQVDVRPAADPQAQGVIVAQAQGRMLRLTPQGESLGGPEPFSVRYGLSKDGRWLAVTDCKDNGCSLVLGADAASWNVEELTLQLKAPFHSGEWAPDASVFAALDIEGNLSLIDPTTRTPRLVRQNVSTFAWAAGDELVFASSDGAGARLWRSALTGSPTLLAQVGSPVKQLFASPDAREFAFAQDDAAGWRLMSVGVSDGLLRDFGNLGGGLLGTAPPFAIAWSPDGSHIAVGPVSEPFDLHIVTAGQSPASYRLEKGYAGELKWSPDGSSLAISTYSPNRVWHEVFVVAMNDLASGPRFLLDGCEIVWSPDGQFVAVKREAWRAQAVAAIRIDTGDYWHVIDMPNLVPVAWGVDSDAATRQATSPVRRWGQLGK